MRNLCLPMWVIGIALLVLSDVTNGHGIFKPDLSRCVSDLDMGKVPMYTPGWESTISYLKNYKTMASTPYYKQHRDAYCYSGHNYYGSVSNDCYFSLSDLKKKDNSLKDVISTALKKKNKLCLACSNDVTSCNMVSVCSTGSKCFKRHKGGAYYFYNCCDYGEICYGMYDNYLCDGDLCNSDMKPDEIKDLLDFGKGPGGLLGIVFKILMKIVDTIMDFIHKIISSVIEKTVGLVLKAIETIFKDVIMGVLNKIFDSVSKIFEGVFGSLFGDIGKQLFTTIKDKIKDMLEKMFFKAFEIVGKILSGIIKTGLDVLFKIVKGIIGKVVENFLGVAMGFAGKLDGQLIGDILSPIFGSVSGTGLFKRSTVDKREEPEAEITGFSDFAATMEGSLETVLREYQYIDDPDAILKEATSDYLGSMNSKREVNLSHDWRKDLKDYTKLSLEDAMSQENLMLDEDGIIGEALKGTEKREISRINEILEQLLTGADGRRSLADLFGPMVGTIMDKIKATDGLFGDISEISLEYDELSGILDSMDIKSMDIMDKDESS